MKSFITTAFDYHESEKEVNEFEAFLTKHSSSKERRDILPFFRKRPHLSAMCGVLAPMIGEVNRVVWEYDLFGDFACDVAVGDWERKSYCFIEFEDADPESIFKKAGLKATREWGRRFEHGYSQIIDWLHKLAKMSEHPDFEGRFGKRTIAFEGALVIGRDKDLVATEMLRLEWRQEHVVVHSKHIACITFDELLRQMQRRLKTLSLLAKAALNPVPAHLPAPPGP